MKAGEEAGFSDPAFVARLSAFAQTGGGGEGLLPWVERLSPPDRDRLRSDLSVVLAEPEATGEPLDWDEISEILQEWAESAGWEGMLVRVDARPAEGPFQIDLRPRDEQSLLEASPAVQKAMDLLVREFLSFYPTSPLLLPRGRLKKLTERDTWQVQLPDGYRLRYVVDKLKRTVLVVYLGPHPDRDERGRERTVQVRMNQRQLED